MARRWEFVVLSAVSVGILAALVVLGPSGGMPMGQRVALGAIGGTVWIGGLWLFRSVEPSVVPRRPSNVGPWSGVIFPLAVLWFLVLSIENYKGRDIELPARIIAGLGGSIGLLALTWFGPPSRR